MDPYPPSWSGLRSDLLGNIANRLDSGIDRLCFRAVCYSWRSVLPPPARRSSPPSDSLKLPLRMGPNVRLLPSRRGYFELVHSTVYCLRPLKKITDTWKTTKCWIIKIEETKQRGVARLTDPLSPSADPVPLSPRLRKGLNLFDYRVSEITKVYDLQFVGNNGKIPIAESTGEILSLRPVKVAVCSKGPDLAVMAIHTNGQLSIWKKGDDKWTCLSNGGDNTCYEDVVCHNGKFYAVDVSGLTISVDLSKKIALVTPAMPRSSDGKSFEKRLLSSLGDLFLLDRHSDPLAGENSDSDEDVLTTYFHVHKLNGDERKWVPVTSLGNRAMFVGGNCTFCVSAEEFGGCKKNCIYYMEDFFQVVGADEYQRLRYAALFDMEDCSAKILSGVFGYSGLFWPPPSWVV